ncbi:MAG: hypothetical protein IPP51_04470 [Bacteroidetes bacterium]|nr:hypothetical protein [Bacteroidota bacterium]
MKGILLIFLTVLSVSGSAQRFSRPEKWWALTHPFVACKALKLSRLALAESKKMETDSLLDQDPLGGQVDAFRHAYWMALLSRHMSAKKALSLGRAHEKGNYLSFKKQKADEEGVLTDSLMSVMDLRNNEVGTGIGLASLQAGADTTIMRAMIIQAILEGKLQIVLKDQQGNWLDCDGNKLNISVYLHRWYIPKCLVSSNKKR